jgi:hypothetical protein
MTYTKIAIIKDGNSPLLLQAPSLRDHNATRYGPLSGPNGHRVQGWRAIRPIIPTR